MDKIDGWDRQLTLIITNTRRKDAKGTEPRRVHWKNFGKIGYINCIRFQTTGANLHDNKQENHYSKSMSNSFLT